jgi:hypothetical protein
MFAWTFSRRSTVLCPVACEIDILAPTALAPNAAAALDAKVNIGAAWAAQRFLEMLRVTRGQQTLDLLLRESVLDIQGEIAWVIAAICLLSAKGGVERTEVDLSKINKARKVRGKRPFVSHSTVKIALTADEEREARGSGMTQAEMRQHIVRGHFKVRAGGVYWWRPFIRGRAEAGTVIREGYRVTKR